MTKGGLHGVITALTDTVVTLEIAKDVAVKVSRDAIGAPLKEGRHSGPGEERCEKGWRLRH